jgi:ABC-type glycerol-3-phosphate transport system substrate-binding protein
MRTQQLVAALAAVLTAGLITAGCGGGDESTTVTAPGTTSTPESSTTTTASGSGATPEDIYNSCTDAIKGTPAEGPGQTTCQQARDAFEQCVQQTQSLPEAARENAIQVCQTAAQQTIDALKAAGG